eukprot:1341210-Alexandrium_andersonii.AAC.1
MQNWRLLSESASKEEAGEAPLLRLFAACTACPRHEGSTHRNSGSGTHPTEEQIAVPRHALCRAERPSHLSP